MSIQGTNSVYNSHKSIKREIDGRVRAIESRKDHGRARKYKGALKHFHTRPAICTQCNGAIRPDYARLQIANKMDNAPICLACVLGKTRKYVASLSK